MRLTRVAGIARTLRMRLMDICVQRANTLKPKPDPDTLGFGDIFSDHMFLMDYRAGQGWIAPRIVPYGNLSLAPAAMVLHYAQEVFEGLKAYRCPDGSINIFRPEDNIRRMAVSCERMCMPVVPADLFMEAIQRLVLLDREWALPAPGASLYIRPFMFATDSHLGAHASNNYLFCIILSPVKAYFAEGLNPVGIYVENDDVRAVRGGTGFAKCGGNYAASLRAAHRAESQGYAQILWLDGIHHRYLEEVGAMNVMFKIGGTVVTPALNGSILPGITRSSCLELLKSWGYPVEERQISVDELFDSAENGSLEEAWGTGTAAVISPIGRMGWQDRKIVVNNGETGPIARRLFEALTRIQWGVDQDPHGWIVKLKN